MPPTSTLDFPPLPESEQSYVVVDYHDAGVSDNVDAPPSPSTGTCPSSKAPGPLSYADIMKRTSSTTAPLFAPPPSVSGAATDSQHPMSPSRLTSIEGRPNNLILRSSPSPSSAASCGAAAAAAAAATTAAAAAAAAAASSATTETSVDAAVGSTASRSTTPSSSSSSSYLGWIGSWLGYPTNAAPPASAAKVSVPPPTDFSAFAKVRFAEAAAQMETGDLILFHGEHSIFSETIEWGSGSRWSHIGMVLRGPLTLSEADGEKRTFGTDGGLLMLESGYEFGACADVEDGRRKLGVQIVVLDEAYVARYDGVVAWRQLVGRVAVGEPYSVPRRGFGCEHRDQLLADFDRLHALIHDKPYDLNLWDFLRAKFQVHWGDERKTGAFFCSALVAFAYARLGLITFPQNSGWDMYAPGAFSSEQPAGKPAGLADHVELLEERVLVA